MTPPSSASALPSLETLDETIDGPWRDALHPRSRGDLTGRPDRPVSGPGHPPPEAARERGAKVPLRPGNRCLAAEDGHDTFAAHV
jgi:hypothetical protein